MIIGVISIILNFREIILQCKIIEYYPPKSIIPIASQPAEQFPEIYSNWLDNGATVVFDSIVPNKKFIFWVFVKVIL